jgi:hypothetical protein
LARPLKNLSITQNIPSDLWRRLFGESNEELNHAKRKIEEFETRKMKQHRTFGEIARFEMGVALSSRVWPLSTLLSFPLFIFPFHR